MSLLRQGESFKSFLNDTPLSTVAVLHEQYGEYQLSALKASGESIKNCEYLLKFEFKFEKPSDTE
jgi:hypothetical protein